MFFFHLRRKDIILRFLNPSKKWEIKRIKKIPTSKALNYDGCLYNFDSDYYTFTKNNQPVLSWIKGVKEPLIYDIKGLSNKTDIKAQDWYKIMKSRIIEQIFNEGNSEGLFTMMLIAIIFLIIVQIILSVVMTGGNTVVLDNNANNTAIIKQAVTEAIRGI